MKALEQEVQALLHAAQGGHGAGPGLGSDWDSLGG